MSTDKLVQLLPHLFDAAISEEKWEPALDGVVDYVGAKSALLFAVEQTFETYALAKAGGALKGRQETLADYSAKFKSYEAEAMALFARSKPQSVIRDVDLWPDLEALKLREDYRYQKEKIGIFRRVGARLNGHPAWFDACTIQFADEIEEIPTATLSRLSDLLPSLAKVVELNRFFNILQTKYQAALAALDRVKIGVCVTDPGGNVVLANDEADRIFTLNDGIWLGADRRFLCAKDANTAAIMDAVDAVAKTACGQSLCNGRLLAVERRSASKPFLIEVVPLRDSLQEIERAFAGAMVSIIDPDNTRAFSTENVKSLYGLSAAEAAVCRLLVDGATNEAVADMRNVSVETVRSQTKAIYSKLNVRGRVGLIREVLTLNPPIF